MVSRFLIMLGVVLVVAGLVWPLLEKTGFGRLPGDFLIERGSFRIYFPLTTSILISLVLTLVLWFFNR